MSELMNRLETALNILHDKALAMAVCEGPESEEKVAEARGELAQGILELESAMLENRRLILAKARKETLLGAAIQQNRELTHALGTGLEKLAAVLDGALSRLDPVKERPCPDLGMPTAAGMASRAPREEEQERDHAKTQSRQEEQGQSGGSEEEPEGELVFGLAGGGYTGRGGNAG